MRSVLFALTGALCLASMAFSAHAAPRAVLGNVQNVPLIQVADADLVKRIAGLRAQASDQGTTRVILGLRVPFAPEGTLSGAEQSTQRTDIRAAQDNLLNQVPTLTKANGSLKRYEFIPFVAAEVTLSELDNLLKLPEVTSIEEDSLDRHFLTQSVPVVGGSGGTFSGYNGTGQTVAVLDTGVDKNHTDLSGRVVSEACYSTTFGGTSTSICPGGAASSTATGSAMPYASGVCAAGECDHGTHVAAIAAGAQGVARGSRIIAIQVFSAFPGSYPSCGGSPCALSYYTDQVSGLERVYALRSTYNIAAANMSLGGGSYSSQASCDSASGNPARKAAIDNLRSANIATVIASGNSGYTSSMGSPGCISTAVSVGATGDGSGGATLDQVMSYSNSASFLNLLAPGSKITAAIPNGGYGTWDGTSMATPHVAGAWAVIKSKKPTATVDQVLSALTTTGTSITDYRNSIIKPRINVGSALATFNTGSTSQNLTPIMMLLLD